MTIECQRTDAVIETYDDLGATPPRYTMLTVRGVVLHLINEYAHHNGHADLLRENLDGRIGY